MCVGVFSRISRISSMPLIRKHRCVSPCKYVDRGTIINKDDSQSRMDDRHRWIMLALLLVMLLSLVKDVRGFDVASIMKQLGEYLQRIFNTTTVPILRRFERPTENPLAEWI